MILNKDTEVVKVSAYAYGEYSGSEAYGEVFLNKEYYENNRDKVDNVEVYVSELDGKHSEVQADIEVNIIRLKDILTSDVPEYGQGIYFTYRIDDRLCDELDDFNDSITELYNKFSKTSKFKIVLDQDTNIQGVSIPKGSIVNVESSSSENIPEDWQIEVL